MGFRARGLLAASTVLLALCGSGAPAFAANEREDPPPTLQPANPLLNLRVDLYGRSYHTDREGVRRKHVNNEANLGLGLSYEFHNDDRGVGFVSAGFYKDSGRNWAKAAGPGYQLPYLRRRPRRTGSPCSVSTSAYR